MSLVTFITNTEALVTELRGCHLALLRIAEACERLSPALKEPDPPAYVDSTKAPPVPLGFSVAESGEEYDERIAGENDLAMLIGVAPYSSDFQRAVAEMRSDIMKKSNYVEENGEQKEVPYSEKEANEIIREAFAQAKARAAAEDAEQETGTAAGAR